MSLKSEWRVGIHLEGGNVRQALYMDSSWLSAVVVSTDATELPVSTHLLSVLNYCIQTLRIFQRQLVNAAEDKSVSPF